VRRVSRVGMSYNLLQFNSFEELLKYLDSQIASLSESLSALQRRYESVHARAERMRALERVLEDLLGEKLPTLNEVDYMGLKVVINARAVDELAVLEETLESQRETLEALGRIREVLQRLSSSVDLTGAEGITILVQTLNGIPMRILLKEIE